MSGVREAPKVAYMVQAFGGTLHPDHATLEEWLNDQASAGWRLIAVDAGVGYFERSPVAVGRGVHG